MSKGASLGSPKNGDAEVGNTCAGLNAVSNAEDEGTGTAGGWAAKANGLDTEFPAPKPTNPPNLG